MNQFKHISFTVFMLVFAVICSWGCSANGDTSPAPVVEDDVFSKTHAFDPLLNVVDFRENLPKWQQRPEK